MNDSTDRTRVAFLLEIGTEEIPARMILDALHDLARLIREALNTANLIPGTIRTYGTPRRLAILCEEVPLRQPDHEEVLTGPSVQVAFMPDGTPSRAAIGFARAQGVEPSMLERVKGPKGDVIAVRRHITGKAAKDVLAETLPDLLGKLSFPKTMYWDAGLGPFVRPVHWVVALIGQEVIPFEFRGVSSGRVTFGHRFMAPEPVELHDAGEYEETLRDRFVIASFEERKRTILGEMEKAEKEIGCQFIKEEPLLDEVANLIEYPVFAVGSFDRGFLELPREVLVTAMQSHQRYFPATTMSGELTNTFGVVSNTKAKDMAVVIRGNERVLSARLYDAKFFYDSDKKTGLRSMRSRLSERLFMKDAGNMAEKTERIVKLALDICDEIGLDSNTKAVVAKAADLCKADLMSQMVGEFPELQGIMGSYYARELSEIEYEVAKAIREHYQPRFSGDALPSSVAGAVVALADRLDSIVSCFAVGAIPSGSKDPLGLRRAAIGVLRILIGISEFTQLTLPELLHGSAKDERLSAFFTERFHGILIDDYEIPTDFANAVEDLLFSGPVPPKELVSRARALYEFASETEDFRDFLDNVFKRVGNILRQAEEKFPSWRCSVSDLLDMDKDYCSLLEHPFEVAVEEARIKAMGTYQSARESGGYRDFLAALYSMKGPLAQFFGTGRDGVPVLIETDEAKRLARMALLERVFSQFSWFADFTRITSK